MSFEEMQSILQRILLSQERMQARQEQIESTIDRATQVADSNGRAIQAMFTKQGEIESTIDRVAQTVDRAAQTVDRAAQVADSNGRAIQAMLDNAATDRLQHEARTREHEERMRKLESISLGLVNLCSLIDEDRPTIIRLLNSNNNKLDSILDRLPPQQQ